MSQTKLGLAEARKPLSVCVSTHAIRKGKRKSSGGCVAAEAIHEKLGDKVTRVDVLDTVVRIHTRVGTITRYASPSELRDAVKAFDAGKKWELPQFKLLPTFGTCKSAEAHRGSQAKNRSKRAQMGLPPINKTKRVAVFKDGGRYVDFLRGKSGSLSGAA